MAYTLEDLRAFFIYRPWLHGDGELLSDVEYDAIKARTLTLPAERVAYLRAFRDGWVRARK